jgi:hypothetical protein
MGWYELNLIESLRSLVVKHSLLGPTFARDWTVRRRAIRDLIYSNGAIEAARLNGLGDHLSSIFMDYSADRGGARDQSSVSSGGQVWDSLVNYYLNLQLAGLPAVALSTSFIPAILRRSYSVTYRVRTIDPGLDQIILHLPSLVDQQGPAASGDVVPMVNDAIERAFDRTSVVVLVSKTNWNDNIQTPMLWCLLYATAASGGRLPDDLAVGVGGNRPGLLANSEYAFVTVPTNRTERLGPSSRPVVRGSVMSGGVFWGRENQPDVARSIAELVPSVSGGWDEWPPPTALGLGIEREARSRSGDIDLAAFDIDAGR